MKAALARLQATRAYRVWQRYTEGRGRVLAGGIAYFAFFSLFPALTLGFTIFGVVLRDHPALYHDIVHSVSTTLPGIVKDSEHPDGLLDASTPPTLNVLTITGAIAFVVLVFAGLGWLGALREGVSGDVRSPAVALQRGPAPAAGPRRPGVAGRGHAGVRGPVRRRQHRDRAGS